MSETNAELIGTARAWLNGYLNPLDATLIRQLTDALEAMEPRVVKTVEDLRGLPVDAVAWSDSEEIAYQKVGDQTWFGAGDSFFDSGVHLPVTIIHLPTD